MVQLYKILEDKFSKYVGADYAVACNSGTSALHLALMAIGVGKGDEVILPDFTMAACGFAVSYTGAKPVFVDCGDDLNIDTKLIKAKITKRTKAIMPVHIYGRLCQMDKNLSSL
jgi:dTDP-4-amino-4,6-dideoxygalactose transaminase